MKFASKYLKHNKAVKQSVQSETFVKDPFFYKGKLEVSKHWLKIGSIYIPKNYIIGTCELTCYNGYKGFATAPYEITFILITGECKIDLEISHKEYDEFVNCLYVLKHYLPEAYISEGPVLFGWLCRHEKMIKQNYKEMIKQIGVEGPIYTREDIYEKFSMDGVMLWEAVEGGKMDIEVEGTGEIASGYVEEVLSKNDDKNGCRVRLKESGLVERIQKVYGKPLKREFYVGRLKPEVYYQNLLSEQKRNNHKAK